MSRIRKTPNGISGITIYLIDVARGCYVLESVSHSHSRFAYAPNWTNTRRLVANISY